MAVDMGALTADLAAESADLYEVLAVLAPSDWRLATPAAGWTVQDQVTHLAYFDGTATLSATDPDRFRVEADALVAEGDDFPDRVAARFAGLPGTEVFAWLQRARRAYLDVFSGLDPATPLPWYGPPMSAASSVTARLMETWAHGQDVVDALGRTRAPTTRLRHIAHLGVRTLGWSFRVHGLPVPEEPVRVELTGPDGALWTWGPDGAADRVTGPAEDFCLLVTQRRHRGQTAVVAAGPVAEAWLGVAQAFAGAPGPGRPPTEVSA
ncbi:MAG TPA: TIGR03084 family metal-binding protein [Blastococcus sp.]|nr:TIGR03084 family metal-binding protein [Blastococcus sp.]